MKTKLYISLPISGKNIDEVRRRANFIKGALTEEYDPITPFDICPDSSLPYSELMGRDVAELLKCETILLDWDWRTSRGCRAEYELARIYGLRIVCLAAKDSLEMTEMDNGIQFSLQLNYAQIKALSDACDNYSRILAGQLDTGLADTIMNGITKENKGKENSELIDMYHQAMHFADELKAYVWNCGIGCSKGVGYDDTSDLLYDIHQVIRHHLWQMQPEPKSHYINDAYPAMRFGKEPLAVVTTLKGDGNNN